MICHCVKKTALHSFSSPHKYTTLRNYFTHFLHLLICKIIDFFRFIILLNLVFICNGYTSMKLPLSFFKFQNLQYYKTP